MSTVLTITVLDTATIFEGPDTVYRYDLPGTGIIDGWALAAVLDQAKELCSLHWPDVEVIVDADEPTTEVLTRSLLNKGVAAYPAEVAQETPLPAAGEVQINRPTGGRHRLGTPVPPFSVIVGAVVVLILGLSWWVVGGRPAPPADPTPVSAPAPVNASVAPRTTGVEAADTETQAPGEPEPLAVLEHELLRLEAPAGFHLADRDGMLLAAGEDPALRIHLAADPVHAVPADAVAEQVHLMIAADPGLAPLDPERAARGVEVIRYREDPGDGSAVTWHTWVEDGHQLSVGCHTREEPTVPQEAACRMVRDSVTLR